MSDGTLRGPGFAGRNAYASAPFALGDIPGMPSMSGPLIYSMEDVPEYTLLSFQTACRAGYWEDAIVPPFANGILCPNAIILDMGTFVNDGGNLVSYILFAPSAFTAYTMKPGPTVMPFACSLDTMSVTVLPGHQFIPGSKGQWQYWTALDVNTGVVTSGAAFAGGAGDPIYPGTYCVGFSDTLGGPWRPVNAIEITTDVPDAAVYYSFPQGVVTFDQFSGGVYSGKFPASVRFFYCNSQVDSTFDISDCNSLERATMASAAPGMCIPPVASPVFKFVDLDSSRSTPEILERWTDLALNSSIQNGQLALRSYTLFPAFCTPNAATLAKMAILTARGWSVDHF